MNTETLRDALTSELRADGVAIKRKDATVVPTPAVVDRLEALADERGLPFQPEVAANIGTDTGALRTTAGSTPVGAVSIPVRYHHSTVETAHVDDLAATVDLLVAAAEAGAAGLWPAGDDDLAAGDRAGS